MTDRKQVLESFEAQARYTDERVKSGIEQNRKGAANLTVTKNGQPAPGVKITVKQKTHEFKFGTNLFMLDELETAKKNETYKAAFADVFNMATLPFYWDATEPEKGHTRYAKDSEKLYRRPPIDLCMEFCEKHGIEPREHALAYEHFFPDWLRDASVFEVKVALENRFREIAERYAGKIPTIEVTNEMEWGDGVTAFYDEPDYVEWCFKTAEKYFPTNCLCINEWTGLPWGDHCRATDKYYAYIEANLLKGARIDAIGMQFHMFFPREKEYAETRPFYDPQNLYRHMDLYANFGKPLQITEVTIPAYSYDAADEEMQAEILKRLYSIWFSYKNVEQIVYWNLADGYAAFAPQGDMTVGENYYHGGLLRFDLSKKPAYFALRDLIQKEWHTETEAVTDTVGKADFRGFYGKYDVVIEHDGKTMQKELNLSAKGKRDFTFEL